MTSLLDLFNQERNILKGNNSSTEKIQKSTAEHMVQGPSLEEFLY
jgi:hypothetical protein